MTAYALVLAAHSALRWVVLAVGGWALGDALIRPLAAARRTRSGARGERPAVRAGGDHPSRWFARVLDVQVTLGLVLYVGLSPVTRAARSTPGLLAADGEVRFFAVQHLLCMLVALACAHVAAVRATTRLRWTLVALAALLAGIPWWRPLLPASTIVGLRG